MTAMLGNAYSYFRYEFRYIDDWFHLVFFFQHTASKTSTFHTVYTAMKRLLVIFPTTERNGLALEGLKVFDIWNWTGASGWCLMVNIAWRNEMILIHCFPSRKLFREVWLKTQLGKNYLTVLKLKLPKLNMAPENDDVQEGISFLTRARFQVPYKT